MIWQAVSQTPQAHAGQFLGGVIIAILIVMLISGGGDKDKK